MNVQKAVTEEHESGQKSHVPQSVCEFIEE